jgi:hypothetical protein
MRQIDARLRGQPFVEPQSEEQAVQGADRRSQPGDDETSNQTDERGDRDKARLVGPHERPHATRDINRECKS